MLDRNWERIIISLLLVVFGMPGCALLQNAPVVELPPSRLTCETNPEMVDGDLETVGTFQANGSIRKMYLMEDTKLANSTTPKYQVKFDGILKTETLIKLDKPTYLTYIEIYPGSDIPKLALDFTAEEKSPEWHKSFIVVKDKRHTKVEEGQVTRFAIRQEVLYLRITADSIEDQKNKKSIKSDEPHYSHEIVVPLKGTEIREVKFYERM